MGSPQQLTAVADPAPRTGGRVAPLLRTAAVAWLLVLGCLALWALGPRAVGWQPAVVVTGSMLPTIRPGDVVVVDPGARVPGPGRIVLARDPSMPSGQVAHRVVEVRPDGTFVTRGDANPTADVLPRRPQDVVGTVRLVVPAAGRLAMLRHGPGPVDLAWALAAVAACLGLGLSRPPD